MSTPSPKARTRPIQSTAAKAAAPKGAAAAAKRLRSPGRPPASELESRQAHLLEVAAEEFLAHGYGEASLARVATNARVSKKTIYARYANKDELLLAVVKWLMSSSREPLLRELSAPEAAPEAALYGFALRVARGWTSAREIGLYRLIAAEAVRFPELAEVYRESMKDFRGILRDYLVAQCQRKVLVIAEAEMDAVVRLFSLMTIGEIREQTLFGQKLQPADIEATVRRGVRMFLRGCERG